MNISDLRGLLNASIAALALNCALTSYAAADNNARTRLIETYSSLRQLTGQGNQAFAIISQIFNILDRNSDGISRDELELAENMSKARVRAQTVSKILSLDLDGDLIVTSDEITKVNDSIMFSGKMWLGLPREQLESKRQAALEKFMLNDTNKNRSLEGKELYAVTYEGKEQQANRHRSEYHLNMARAMLDADPNSDDLITEQEALTLMADIAKDLPEIDLSTRGYITGNHGDCPNIAVSKGSQLYLVSGFEGSQISNVSVAGQDKETYAATLNIEDGDGQISVAVYSFGAMIWNFTGRTDRIEKVIATSKQVDQASGESSVGVVGIPKDKIVFLKSGLCLEAQYRENEKNSKARTQLARMTGVLVNGIVSNYSLGVVSLPTAKNTKTRVQPKDVTSSIKAWASRQSNNPYTKFAAQQNSSTFSEQLSFAEDYLKFNELGLADFDPNKVVSTKKAENYKVLPQHLGIMQLMMAGKLEAIIDKKDGRDKLKIIAPMRYPAGLSQARRIEFLINPSMAMPEGSPSESCVRSEDGKSSVEGMDC